MGLDVAAETATNPAGRRLMALVNLGVEIGRGASPAGAKAETVYATAFMLGVQLGALVAKEDEDWAAALFREYVAQATDGDVVRSLAMRDDFGEAARRLIAASRSE